MSEATGERSKAGQSIGEVENERSRPPKEEFRPSKDEFRPSKDEFRPSKDDRVGNHIPSVVVSRGRSEGRSRSTRKKEDFTPRTRSYGEERRGGYSYRGSGRRRDDFSRRSDFKKSNDYDNVQLIGLPEDSRISTCLRRLAREEDEKKFADICKTLQGSLAHPDNTAYIRRALDNILESLYALISNAVTPSCKKAAARTLGHVGYVLDKDFNKFMDWIFSKFHSEISDQVRTLTMTALHELSNLDKESPRLHDFAQKLMTDVREIMEITYNGEIFIMTTEITLTLTHRYPDTFTQYFNDTIDIIVGWHIDPAQPRSVTKCAAKALKRLAPYWLNDMSFTVTLLQQFLEDSDACFEELTNPKKPSEDEEPISKDDQLTKITAFILVFKSVFKGLEKNMSPTVCANVTNEFLENSLSKVMEIVLKSLTISHHNDLIVAGNKCITVILEFINSESDVFYTSIVDYISTIVLIKKLTEKPISSLLKLINKLCISMPNKTSVELIDYLLAPNSFLLTKRLTTIDSHVIHVYETLLNHAQETIILQSYKHVVEDIDALIRSINPNLESICTWENNSFKDIVYDEENAVDLIIFMLRILQEISLKQNFILEPSLFEIFAVLMPKVFKASNHPIVHQAYMNLLRSHCIKNNYFIQTELVQNAERQMNILIKLLIENLNDNSMDAVNKLFVIRWANDILSVANEKLKMSSVEIVELTKGIFTSCSDSRPSITSITINILQNVLKKYKGLWPPELISKVLDLCVYFLNSNLPEIRKHFHRLMMLLPSVVVIFSLNSFNGLMNDAMVRNYRKLARCEESSVEQTSFTLLMKYLIKEENADHDFKWMTELVARGGLDAGETHELMSNIGLTQERLAYEAATHCRDARLKTALGKPIQTCTTIENAIRDLALETKTSKNSLNHATGRRVRLLLQFVEQLEKAVYNAAEGTASAFPFTTIPQVKTFFSKNRGSCYDWFFRMRFVTMIVAIHCGMAACAVRHGFALLQSHFDNNTTNAPEFRITLVNVGWALANMGEADAIAGLYEWAKTAANVKEPILEPLIDVAARKYEAATDKFLKFTHLLSSEESENMCDSNKILIADQLTESYLALNNWQELAEWKKLEMTFFSNENGCSSRRYKNITLNYAESMAKYEEGDLEGAKELLKWNEDEGFFPKDRTSWDYNNILQETDYILKCTMVKDGSKLKYEEAKTLSETIIEECIKDSPSELIERAVLLKYTSHSLLSGENYVFSPFYGANFCWSKLIKSPEMERLAWWGHMVDEKSQYKSPYSKDYLLQCVKSSRKIGNIKYATKLLLKCVVPGESLEEVAENYMNDLSEGDYKTHKTMVQVSKLLKTQDVSSSLKLSSSIAFKLSKSVKPEMKVLGASVLRNIASAVKQGKVEDLRCPELDRLLMLDEKILSKSFEDHDCFGNVASECGMSDEESLTGRLLRLSLKTCPNSSKSWERVASWAYSAGVKESTKGIVSTEEEKAALESQLPDGVTIDCVCSILAAYHSHDVDAYAVSAEMIGQQLLELKFTPQQIDSLLSTWKKTHSHVYSFFRLSVHSYFNFIQISENQENNVVTATLRLLRLIVRHASELQNVVESGLAATLTAPWTAIVPQLFSRLNHPEPYVRRCLSELLIRIGNDTPHLITFPAVVGSDSSTMPTTNISVIKYKKTLPKNEDEEIEEEDDDDYEEEEENNERDSGLENSFTHILDELSKKYGQEIAQVKTFITELRRITLLWDELWLGTLNRHQADINRRFNQLNTEIKSTETNASLDTNTKKFIISEKYRLILKPILFALEQLKAITFVTPETPHEKLFQEKYSKDIENVINKLKHPENLEDPISECAVLSTLIANLQASLSSGRQRGGNLSMKEISPALVKLKFSKIAMPGVVKDPATIKSISDTVTVLQTITKPKKLVFHGSNGVSYTYLFKGLEDLHLDERIMQFLSIANSMLKETNLRAHHYSVVPLGPRSGLISWVDDVTPIFILYKKWQDRVVTEDTKESMRVSNLFYSKLAPLLKEVGINNINTLQRNKWPQKVLKKVLTDLMQITPNYLLSKELWCYSLNAAKWWNVTKLYSTSLAVMSMIGYVIGLGDRHLDNVLVNLKTGEVVHIDYNVCFEKGKTLFVPEKVPFRLTQNLSTALGVTGIEGTFRKTCERVLEVLRQGQETLLTLLEAFVYDPLIDWTPLNEAGYTGAVYGGGRILASETRQSKKDLEREVTTCMLKVRLTEVKQQWLENKNNLRSDLRELQKAIENWIQDEKNAHQCQEELKERHTQMAVLKEAEGQPQHSLYTVGRRYAKHLHVYSARQKTLETLNAKVQEYEAFIERYNTVMSSLRGPDLPNWISEVKSRPMSDNCQVFDLIKEFLHNAGQGSMVQQCINSEKDVGELCLQQTQLTAKVLEMLAQYGEISRQYPFSLLARHRAVLYKKWSEQLLLDLSPITCKSIIDEMAKMLMVTEDAIRQAGMYSAGLHRHAAEASAWLAKAKYRFDNNAAPSNKSFSVLEKIKTIEAPSLTGVVLTALCALNKKLIMVETQTISAGDCLLNLTSREGDWFLDDMCTLTSTAVKLAKLLPNEDVSSISIASNAIQAAASQYNSLQGLHNNFMGIILVEAMQALQSEEPSVVSMVATLENVIGSVLFPLSEILVQLQNQLRNVLLGSMTKDPSLIATIEMLKAQFNEMLRCPRQTSLSQGDMLLIGFNGLFVDLEQGRQELLGHLKALRSPPAWKIVDQIRDAIHLYTAPVHQDAAIMIIEDMFFIKKIQTMLEVFRMVRADASGFRGAPSPQVPHDRETLTRPVRKYIADYISYQMLGVFSLPLATFICRLLEKENFDVTGEVGQKDIGTESRVPLDELCKKMIEKLCNQQQVRQASGIISQAEAIWRQEDMLSRQERELNNARALDHRLRLTLMAHHWIHEHCLLNATPPLNRANFIMEIKNATSAIVALQQKIKEATNEQNNLIMSAEQRLKWASGANPALSEVMSAFHSSVCVNKQRITDETNLTFTLLNICNTILYYEVLRTPTTDAIEHDKSFAILVSECEKTYYLVSKTTSSVSLSPSEEGLLSLLPPEKKIDQEWIRNVGDKISDSIRKLNAKQDVLYSNCFQSDELVKSKATAIRTIMAKHHRMIADIRTLLKNLVKIDDIGPPGLNEYLSQYKKFTDLISSMTKSLAMSVTLNSSILKKASDDSQFLYELTPCIYKKLLEFGTSDILFKRPPLVRQATVCESPEKGEDPKKPKRSGVQERNAYATNVLRRVKFKLEGRDPDPGVRSSIKQQVDWTISEATSLDNLSLLYEGWTPWV